MATLRTPDPLRNFVETLSASQKAALARIVRVRHSELQVGLAAASAAMTKIYAEFDAAQELLLLLAPARKHPPSGVPRRGD